MSEEELQHEWDKYTRLITAAETSVMISGSTFVFTLGASGVSLIFSAAAIYNAREKRKIIKNSMLARFKHNPRTRMRDLLSGFVLSATVNGLSMGVGDLGTTQLISEAMQHGWVEIVNHRGAVSLAAGGAQLGAGTAIED